MKAIGMGQGYTKTAAKEADKFKGMNFMFSFILKFSDLV